MATAVADGSSLFGTIGYLPPEEVIFGRSEAMNLVRQRVEKVAKANIPVLILGQSGTGKELIAKLLHASSPWSDGPFVKVNCPAIPGTLIESELFGYEKGAFTGAYGTKPGRMELAHRGTLFLDEISELELGLQTKLLQFLQDGQFCRIGAQADRRVDARVICATNRQLEHEIEAGTFRQDLYYRINILNIRIPSLAERRADIPGLVKYFMGFYGDKFKSQPPPVSHHLMKLLMGYEWPGNIRQLENLVKRYVILGSEEAIVSDLEGPRQDSLNYNPEIAPDGSVPLKKVTRQVIQELERKIILKVLQANHWNRKRTARSLGISYRALLYKIRQAQLPSSRSRAETISA